MSQPSDHTPPATSWLNKVAKSFFVVSALALLLGDVLIHFGTKMHWFQSELIGLGVAAIFALLGFLSRSVDDYLKPDNKDS